MPNTLANRLRHAWNAFLDRDPINMYPYDIGPGSGTRPDRSYLRTGSERSIISSVYTRIGIDVSSVSIQHIRIDENNRYLETIDSGLNNCLSVEANVDQTGRAFIQDLVFHQKLG